MSKRKAPQGDNPNKDICDMIMGEVHSVLNDVATLSVVMVCLSHRTCYVREERRKEYPQGQCLQVSPAH